jgi:hypothetical protein
LVINEYHKILQTSLQYAFQGIYTVQMSHDWGFG